MNADEKVKWIFVEELKIPEVAVSLDTEVRDLGIYPMLLLELSIFLADEFGLSVSDDELHNMETVADIIRLIGEV